MATDSERLVRIETMTESLHNRLIGTEGNAGELSHIYGRIAKLENWRWWVMGIAVGGGALAGGALRAIAEAILK